MSKGKMTIIIKEDSKSSDLKSISILNQLIKDDINKKDYKSLKYHKMALKKHKENLKVKLRSKDVVK